MPVMALHCGVPVRGPSLLGIGAPRSSRAPEAPSRENDVKTYFKRIIMAVQKKYKIAFIAVFLALLFFTPFAFLVKPYDSTGNVRKMILESVLPLEGLLHESVCRVRGAWKRYLLLVRVEKENEALRKELNVLKNKLNDLREADLEVRRLRKLLGLQENMDLPMVMARVTGGEKASVFQVLYVNKGTADGVRVGMPVLTGAGVGGRIVEAAWNVAKVLLITDFNSNVDALVQRNRVQGILQGAGSAGCFLKYVPVSEDIRVGDEIVTSGMVGIFPKGCFLGTVTRIDTEEAGLFQKIAVKPAVDPTLLEEVAILVDGVGREK